MLFLVLLGLYFINQGIPIKKEEKNSSIIAISSGTIIIVMGLFQLVK